MDWVSSIPLSIKSSFGDEVLFRLDFLLLFQLLPRAMLLALLGIHFYPRGPWRYRRANGGSTQQVFCQRILNFLGVAVESRPSIPGPSSFGHSFAGFGYELLLPAYVNSVACSDLSMFQIYSGIKETYRSAWPYTPLKSAMLAMI